MHVVDNKIVIYDTIKLIFVHFQNIYVKTKQDIMTVLKFRYVNNDF